MTTPPTSIPPTAMPSNPNTTDPSSLAVDIENLSVIRNDTPILDHLSLRIPSGSCCVLLGPNGCGKTTLTRCINGSMFITQGSVRVLGQTIGETDIRLLRQHISIVNPSTDSASQHSPGSVVDADLSTLDAVCTGYFSTVGLYDQPSPQQIQHATQLLQQVGLQHRLHLRLNLLSTGEQRRALIARALVRRPKLLILDEPTAGLDITAREHLLATLSQLLAPHPSLPPITTLFITHHVEEIPPYTHQVILMKQGRILASGLPNQILTPESLSQTFDCKLFVKRINQRWYLEVLPEAWLDLTRPPAN